MDVQFVRNNCNRVGHVAIVVRQPFSPNRFNPPQTGYPQRQSLYNQRNTFSGCQSQYLAKAIQLSGVRSNPRVNLDRQRPTRFPALPPPRPPPPPPLHAISQARDDFQDQVLYRFA